jgi:GDP-4-dehydro-6-deoxy-D-mannose reductase
MQTAEFGRLRRSFVLCSEFRIPNSDFMRSLITGITGFVGSHLAEHLRAAGDAVLGVRRDAGVPMHFDPAVLAGIPIVDWNVGAGEPAAAVRQTIEAFAPDVVFHLAALSIPRDCGTDVPTPAALQTNVEAVRHVVAFTQTLTRRPRIVFASTSHVYAPIDPARPVVAESDPLGPRNAYGKTKLAAEQLLEEAGRRGEADFVVARLFSQSGPRQDGRLMLAEWAAQFVRGDDPVQVLSLDVTLDFLDVRDGVRALRLLALHGASNGIYNVGSGTARTSGEVFRALQQAAGDERQVQELRPGARSEPIADVGKLVAAAGWSPEVPIERTVADALDDWRRRHIPSQSPPSPS